MAVDAGPPPLSCRVRRRGPWSDPPACLRCRGPLDGTCEQLPLVWAYSRTFGSARRLRHARPCVVLPSATGHEVRRDSWTPNTGRSGSEPTRLAVSLRLWLLPRRPPTTHPSGSRMLEWIESGGRGRSGVRSRVADHSSMRGNVGDAAGLAAAAAVRSGIGQAEWESLRPRLRAARPERRIPVPAPCVMDAGNGGLLRSPSCGERSAERGSSPGQDSRRSPVSGR